MLTIGLAVLCLFFKAEAQFYKPSDKTIRMGEMLPESFYQTIHQAINPKTGEATTTQLKDYKDKLIILDFWATWCGPCIYSLNKLDSIKIAMKNDHFVVIPVTYQSIKEVKPVLSKFNWSMASIINDTTLAQIFPHSGIPHQIWIKDNKVIAIPKWDYSSSDNILKAIQGKTMTMVQNIQDKEVINPKKPLFINGNGNTGLYYQGKNSVITRYLPDYGTQALEYLQFNDTTVLYGYNLPIAELFYQAFKKEIFPAFDSQDGIKWLISDRLKNRFFKKPQQSIKGDYKQDSLFLAWQKKNIYGYDLRYPRGISHPHALKLMQEDLNQFFGLYLNLKASITQGPKHKYLVLHLKGSKDQAIRLLKSKSKEPSIDHSGERYRYKKMLFGQHLCGRLASSKLVKELTVHSIIDSSGIDPNLLVDFNLLKTIKGNLSIAQKELDRYGLSLTLEEKETPILLIRDGSNPSAVVNEDSYRSDNLKQ